MIHKINDLLSKLTKEQLVRVYEVVKYIYIYG